MLKYFEHHENYSLGLFQSSFIRVENKKDLEDSLFYIFVIQNGKKTKIAGSEFFSY